MSWATCTNVERLIDTACSLDAPKSKQAKVHASLPNLAHFDIHDIEGAKVLGDTRRAELTVVWVT